MPFHIHVPKPLHGWKAFFYEIAVIVLGVLIALALEAGVEWLHWQHKVAEGEERLKDELLWTGAYMAEQVAVAPCIEAQLNQLEARLTASKQINDPAPLIHSGGIITTLRVPSRTWPSQTWEALQQDGTSNHMLGDVQATLGRVYQKTIIMRDSTIKSEDSQGSFRLLGYPIELTADIKADLLRDIGNQFERTKTNAFLAGQTLAQFQKLKFAPSYDEIEHRRGSLTPWQKQSLTTVKYCKQANLPLANWQAEITKYNPQ